MNDTNPTNADTPEDRVSGTTVCSSSVVVTFGKYKGKTVSRLVRDVEYAKWLLKQTWFKNHRIYDPVVAEINRKHNATIGVPKVYFIINDAMTRLKIGTSVHPKKRMRSIQTGNPETLAMYGTVLGDRVFERQLHDELSEHRLNGEWFAFKPCKPRVDEILGKDREVSPKKMYSLWEFRLITGLSEDQIKYAEWVAAKAGIGKWGMAGGGPWDALRSCSSDGDKIRGWMWCKIIESGCLRKKPD